jgi:hypothetical protein
MSLFSGSGTCATCSFCIWHITMVREHTSRYTRMRQYRGLFRPLGAFTRHQFSADYTMTISGFDFRQRQVLAMLFSPSGAFFRHQFSADYIISIAGFDFRQAQRPVGLSRKRTFIATWHKRIRAHLRRSRAELAPPKAVGPPPVTILQQSKIATFSASGDAP